MDKNDCFYADLIEQHEKEIDRIKHGDWYDNKELFETMMAKFEEVSLKIDEMNKNMAKYNGLIEDRKEDRKIMETNKEKISILENIKKAEEKNNQLWKDNIHWIIYILIFLGGVATRFLPGG